MVASDAKNSPAGNTRWKGRLDTGVKGAAPAEDTPALGASKKKSPAWLWGKTLYEEPSGKLGDKVGGKGEPENEMEKTRLGKGAKKESTGERKIYDGKKPRKKERHQKKEGGVWSRKGGITIRTRGTEEINAEGGHRKKGRGGGRWHSHLGNSSKGTH